jgi:hypothetical protein
MQWKETIKGHVDVFPVQFAGIKETCNKNNADCIVLHAALKFINLAWHWEKQQIHKTSVIIIVKYWTQFFMYKKMHIFINTSKSFSGKDHRKATVQKNISMFTQVAAGYSRQQLG